MIHNILVALWFFLPAAMANVVPVFLARLPGFRRLNTPIDFGKKWHGKPIFGAHKTWRGLIGGVIAATLTLWLQVALTHNVESILGLVESINYVNINFLIVGPLFGIGALGGDAIESFLKRRRGIPAGHTWFPWDQLDYVIGASLATCAFVSLTPAQYATILVIWSLSSLFSSWLGHKMGLKDVPN